MPDISAVADAFREWEKLIGALDENGALIPGHEAQKDQLAAILAEARQLKIVQESFAGNRAVATDRFLHKVDEGRQKFSQIRNFIVSVVGPRSSLLSLFNIPPKPEKIVNPTKRKGKARPVTPGQPSGTSPAGTSNPPSGTSPASGSESPKASDPEKAKD
jgi:hypothetical protein